MSSTIPESQAHLAQHGLRLQDRTTNSRARASLAS